jgi:hypothetical protein
MPPIAIIAIKEIITGVKNLLSLLVVIVDLLAVAPFSVALL